MKTEHLEPVTDFAALRTLLRVVVKSCRYCGANHAATLIRKEARTAEIAPNVVDWTVAWIADPSPACVLKMREIFGGHVDLAVTPLAVEQGRVFRIVDEDLQGEATTRARKLERVE